MKVTLGGENSVGEKSVLIIDDNAFEIEGYVTLTISPVVNSIEVYASDLMRALLPFQKQAKEGIKE